MQVTVKDVLRTTCPRFVQRWEWHAYHDNAVKDILEMDSKCHVGRDILRYFLTAQALILPLEMEGECDPEFVNTIVDRGVKLSLIYYVG